MKPKSIKLSKEDFPKQADWIDPLLRPINELSASVVASFAPALGADGPEMAAVMFREMSFTTDSDVLNSFPLYFAVPQRPRSVKVAQAIAVNDGASFTSAVFPTWELASDGADVRVKVRHLSGLSTSAKYRVVFEVTF